MFGHDSHTLASRTGDGFPGRITSYNVCYTKLLRLGDEAAWKATLEKMRARIIVGNARLREILLRQPRYAFIDLDLQGTGDTSVFQCFAQAAAVAAADNHHVFV